MLNAIRSWFINLGLNISDLIVRKRLLLPAIDIHESHLPIAPETTPEKETAVFKSIVSRKIRNKIPIGRKKT